MNRGGSGPDRQKTNLYWPEEADSPSIHEYSPSKNSRHKQPPSRDSSSRTSSVSYDSQNSGFDDVNTREMVRKQQESKIQFYDYDNTFVPPSRTITPSSVAKNLSRESPEAEPSNRKLQTLQSRIEFYDYIEDAPQPILSPQKIRSSVNHNNATRGGTQLKSESQARPINNSSDSNFVQETYALEDRTDGHDGRRPINRMHKAGHKNLSQRPATSAVANAYAIPIHVEVVQQRPVGARNQKLSSNRPSDGGGEGAPRQMGQRKQLSSSVIDLSVLDLDDPELEDLKKLKQPPSIDEINKKLSTFRSEIKISSNSRTTTDQPENDSYGAAKSRPPTQNHFHVDDQSPKVMTTRKVPNGGGGGKHTVYDDGRQSQRLYDGHCHRSRDPSSPTAEGAPNEARRMAHRHLQSSFSFGAPQTRSEEVSSAVPGASGARRPYSIRDTAVGRVGVGLPDI